MVSSQLVALLGRPCGSAPCSSRRCESVRVMSVMSGAPFARCRAGRCRTPHDHEAEQEGDGGGVVRVLVDEREAVGVQVRRPVGADHRRRQGAHQLRFVEELERPDDREDHRQQDGWPDGRNLDRPGHPDLAGAIDPGSLVQLGRDGAQSSVQDDHVVADELPVDDVDDREEHPVWREERRRRRAEVGRDLGERAEVGSVQEAPHQGGDHAGHGVRNVDGQPAELGQLHQPTVQRQREEDRQDQHDRHLDEQEQGHPPDAGEEARIGERTGVVVQTGELEAADQLLAEERQVAGVEQRNDDHRQEDHEERQD